MKLLLTSAGISIKSIYNALVGLLGKPVAEASALFVPSAIYAIEKLAATLSVPSYLIDDQTAIKVTDDAIEVISEGNWKLITPDTP